MTSMPRSAFLAVIACGALWGCASTKEATQGGSMEVITQEEIQATGAVNLYDVVSRLRPQWLNVRTMSSFNLTTEVVVYQNDLLLGGADALRQMNPEMAWQLRWMDGTRATATLPGLSSGRHVVGAIIVVTRPPDRN